jgi:hypothetical protein
MLVLGGMFPGAGRAGDASSAWPKKGAVDYRASYGQGGLVIGQGHYSWEHDGQKYLMRLALETTGMAAMLYKLDYVQLSQGTIEKYGLRPLRFDVNQQGRTPETALFDWNGDSGARVSLRRGEEERRNFELAPGDQDILSIWRQVAHAGGQPDSLLVVANKNARRARIKSLEEAVLDVPAGRFATRHFSALSEDGRLKIDIWLADTHHKVPVRIILGDEKSETIVFEATAIRVSSSE